MNTHLNLFKGLNSAAVSYLPQASEYHYLIAQHVSRLSV